MSATPSTIDDPADLTAPWLTDVLRTSGVNASVSDVAVTAVGTGQMASCYRATPSYGEGAGPEHLIVKLPAPDPTVRASGATTYRAEVRFYQQIAPGLDLPVPRSYFADVDVERAAFTLVLADMAPAAPGDQLTGCTPEQAEAAAVAIAGLHAGTWCDPTLGDQDWLIPSFAEMAPYMGPMLQETVDTFASKRTLAPATIDVFRRFAADFENWATGRPLPWSLLHNDYRLDNLLFAPAGTDLPPVTVLDWQSLSTGLPLRDVAFLLGTGLEPEVRRAHERRIVSAYHQELLQRGVSAYDAERCWDDYRHGLFHGPLICLLGDAIAAPTERGVEMFTVMAERTAAAIQDVDAFDV
jgi:aminoglycoside phosphotransferase (APT) family kinase protein